MRLAELKQKDPLIILLLRFANTASNQAQAGRSGAS